LAFQENSHLLPVAASRNCHYIRGMVLDRHWVPVKIDSTIFWERIRSPVQQQLQEWKKHPELSKTANKLKPGTDPARFLDDFAEYSIARCFVQMGCDLAVEVPNPSGRCADFKFWKGSDCLYAHVKHLNPDQYHARQEVIEIRIEEELKKIQRPVSVWLHLPPDLTNSQAGDCMKWAKVFAKTASIGAKETILDAQGVKLGMAALPCEHNGNYVQTWVNFGPQVCTDHDRLPAKFREARGQFMPGATNVVFLACNRFTDSDYMEFENFLLGSTWGVRDQSMNLIQSGRKADGFWSDTEHPDSQAAVCFRFMLPTGEIEPRTWIREGRENELPAWFVSACKCHSNPSSEGQSRSP